ncbi:hypothetical protein [Sphingobacterium sp. G1-14]|uniref:hypothetical protein n=1 Tax=Sphingobacterium TaxID=28453 RepID=UPI000B492561|nr:hypothetical protein [Sphingobacterium sp. G1-14]
MHNCHYYTFGPEYATGTAADMGRPKWVYSIGLPTSEWMKVTGDVQAGDVVMYNGVTPDGTSHGLLHSGKVIEAINGKASLISSKMGEYEIISHHPRDVPPEYGSTNPTYTFGGETYQSRVYYRKK